MIVTTVFQRKTFVVQATQVTEDNVEELAEMCGGEAKIYVPDVHHASGNYRTGQICIEMSIGRNGRKARAFLGDWITHIHGSTNFKIYRDKTFHEAFEEVLRDFPEEMMRKVVREELKALLESMAKTASGQAWNYASSDLEGYGLRAIENVAEREAALMPHAWNCEKRNPQVWGAKCSCGVGDE